MNIYLVHLNPLCNTLNACKTSPGSLEGFIIILSTIRKVFYRVRTYDALSNDVYLGSTLGLGTVMDSAI